MPRDAMQSPAARTLTPRGRPAPLALARPVEVLSPGLLRTARLELRPLRAADRPAFLHALHLTREALARWCPLHRPGETDAELFERQLQMTREGDAKGSAWRRAAFLADGRFAGCFNLNAVTRGLSFCADANWWVSAEHSGHGLASEGVAAMLDVALDDLPRGLGLHRVSALISPDNAPSIAVALRAGMARTGEATVPLEHAGHAVPHDVYARTVLP